jgi:YtkA-like
MSNLINRRRLLWSVPVIIVAAAGLGVAAMMQPPPADLDLSLRKATTNGHYIASMEPGLSPIVVGTMHGWIVEITTPSGQPVEHAEIFIDGGMPQHGHGLPTEPKVTAELGGGRYQIEGMKFNMPGWWTINVSVKGLAGPDTATFNLII